MKRSLTPINENVTKKFKTEENLNEDSIFDDITDEDFKCFNDDDDFDDISDDFKCINGDDQMNKYKIYRCLVNSVSNNNGHILLNVRYEDKLERNVILSGSWTNVNVKVGDICNVINPSIMKNDRTWIIDDNNKDSLMIIEPDFMVTGTVISNLTYCKRKSVLNSFYQSNIESMSNKAMSLGSCMHTLFQETTKLNNLSIEGVDKKLKDIVADKKSVMEFYQSGMNTNEVINNKDVSNYKRNAIKWIQTNIKSGENKIMDIEESFMSSQFGLKGKIDLTLKDKNGNLKPLELKTGRSSCSAEHSAQVLLYCLLLSSESSTDKKDAVSNNGTLLYLKDNTSFNIDLKMEYIRSILQNRNEYIRHYLQFISNTSVTSRAHTLPEVINNERQCGRCEMLPVCGMYSKLAGTQFPADHFMREKLGELLQHLTEEDFNFFQHWVNLVIIENFSEADLSSKSIMEPIIIKKDNYGIRRAVLVTSQPDENNCYLFTFEFSKDMEHHLGHNDMVIVSSDDGKQIGVLTGFVHNNIELDRITIRADKYLTCSRKIQFRIDRNTSTKIAIRNLSVLSDLMLNIPNCERLRKYLIHKIWPKLEDSSCEDLTKFKPILRGSNHDQIKSIYRTMKYGHYQLIKGYPGTGKSTCIVKMIRVFVNMGWRIMVSAYTHSAVMNILTKLSQHIDDFLYISGDRTILDSVLKTKTLDYMIFDRNIKDTESLEKELKKFKVIGATCLSSFHPVLSRMSFDLIIVDEAGQITLPNTLMPLMKLDTDSRIPNTDQVRSRFVLFGDMEQLPPLVRNENAKIRPDGLDVSLFEKLCSQHPGRICHLTIQYRMNREIMRLANETTYENKMTCANDNVAQGTINRLINKTNMDIENLPPFLIKCVSGELDDSILFIDTINKAPTQFNNNITECEIIHKILDQFMNLGISVNDVGIIAPFNDQVDLLRDKLNQKYNFEINTVDQYQGRDKGIIIISFTKSSTFKKSWLSGSILNDYRRLNVAITRAKYKLILIGDAQYLEKHSKPILKILQLIPDNWHYQI